MAVGMGGVAARGHGVVVGVDRVAGGHGMVVTGDGVAGGYGFNTRHVSPTSSTLKKTKWVSIHLTKSLRLTLLKIRKK